MWKPQQSLRAIKRRLNRNRRRPAFRDRLNRVQPSRFESLEPRTLLSLLGVSPDNPEFNFTFVTNNDEIVYTAANGAYVLTAEPTDFVDPNDPGNPVDVTNDVTTRHLELNFSLDSSGNFAGGVPGDDLVIEGTVDIDGDTVPDYTGTLLTAEMVDFGFLDVGTGSVDFFDMRLTITGGSMAGLFVDGGGNPVDLGMVVTSENSNFVNDFTVNFTGRPKGEAGSIPTVQPAMIGDFVWDDKNANGIQDPEDADRGIPGVTVKLLADTDGDGDIDDIVQTLVTADGSNNFDYDNDGQADPVGFYKFNNLTPGIEYKVMFNNPDVFDADTNPDGYMFSPRQVHADPDSGDNSDGPMSDVVVLEPGEFNDTIDTGLFRKGSIHAYGFLDENGNGQQDDNEGAFPDFDEQGNRLGKTFELLFDEDGDGDQEVIDTQITANGMAWFVGLTPGEYTVRENPVPDGFMLTTLPNERTFVVMSGTELVYEDDAAMLPDGDQRVEMIPLDENGQEDGDLLRWGNTELAMLGDYVWFDENQNGLQDDDEVGVNGAKVILTGGGADRIIGTADDTMDMQFTTTNPDDNTDGFYKFNDLIPGVEYKVTFELPAGFDRFTIHDQGNDDTIDSDANIFNGNMTPIVTLESGEFNDTLDAGVVRFVASLGDRVWYDIDADGIQDKDVNGNFTEPNVAGAKVILTGGGADSVIGTGGDDTMDMQLTDANGGYLFDDLNPGEQYQVTFVLPAGFDAFTIRQAAGMPAMDSDAVTSDIVVLANNEHDPTLDAGVIRFAKLGDRVWEDLDADGIQDKDANGEFTEPGIADVTVKLLDGNGDPVLDANNQPVTTTTDATGMYMFNDLIPGDYQVMFINPDPSVYMSSPVNAQNNTMDAMDSDADPNDGLMTHVTNLEAEEFDDTLDAGFFRKAMLGDYVWFDENENGLQDDDEVGVNGAKVILTGGGADRIIGTADDTMDMQFTTTNPDDNTDGFYKFNDLIPGVEYKVTFELPAGFDGFTAHDQGNDDTIDSDADTTNGNMTPIVTLESGEFNDTLDAGVVKITINMIPDIDIEKFTNGVNADDVADAPLIAPGQTVTWTYKVTNTGNVPFDFDEVVIVDDAGTPGDTSDDFSTTSGDIVFIASSDVGGDGVLSPDEMWLYEASAIAEDLGTAGTSITIDFDGLPAGTIVSNQFPGVFISADGGSTDGNAAMIFNTANPTGGDDDLATPGPGVNNDTPLGNVLIISEDLDASDPDDDAAGGVISFKFDVPVTVDTLDVLDIEGEEAGGSVTLFLQAGGSVSIPIPGLGNNSFQQLDINVDNVVEMQVAFVSSGSVTELVYHEAGRDCYENFAVVTAPGATDTDNSHYCNPDLNPGIDLEKFTNGVDADTEAEAPQIMAGDIVTWTYKVTNTGDVPYTFDEVEIVDDAGTPGDASDDFSTTSGDIVFDASSDVGSDGILSPGEMWVYEASDIAQDLGGGGAGEGAWYNFAGNSGTDGPNGNIRTYSDNGVSVNASAFSRDANGDWDAVFLGAFGGGLGVTDNSEGNGGNGTHRVDNVGEQNYVLFEFSETVIVDAAFLDSVVNDSDLSIWIGTIDGAFDNHVTLSDAVLASMDLQEVNNTGSSGSRWANFNNNEVAGNVLILAASVEDSTPEDRFKIKKMDIRKTEAGCYENHAVVTVPGASDEDNSHYCNSDEQPDPDIDLEKFTNGVNADHQDDAPEIAPGDVVNWTYKVTNTGNVSFMLSDVEIVDDAGTPGDNSDDFGTASGDIVLDVSSDDGNDGILSPGEMWVYEASGVAEALGGGEPGEGAWFNFAGNSGTDGPNGNIRTYNDNGVQVNASAFSRDSGGTWDESFLGAFSSGLGVTDNSEGNGGNGTHRVDNVGEINYVVFEFSEDVIVDAVFLDSVVNDSDISVWIGTVNDPINNHVSLNDALLDGLEHYEVNNTGSSNSRWAGLNDGEVAGNILVIAASVEDTTPEDRFKIKKMDIRKTEPGCYENHAVVTVPGASDEDNSHYCNPDAPPPVQPDGKIGNFVWNDVDMDGQQDHDEEGLAGVTVQLLDATTHEVLQTTVTDENGHYEFCDLDQGDYRVKFIKPDGFVFSPKGQGDHADHGSNADPNTGKTGSIWLDEGEVDNTIDAGLYMPMDDGGEIEVDRFKTKRKKAEFKIKNTGDTEVNLSQLMIEYGDQDLKRVFVNGQRVFKGMDSDGQISLSGLDVWLNPGDTVVIKLVFARYADTDASEYGLSADIGNGLVEVF